jgi:hypothetical protein
LTVSISSSPSGVVAATLSASWSSRAGEIAQQPFGFVGIVDSSRMQRLGQPLDQFACFVDLTALDRARKVQRMT